MSVYTYNHSFCACGIVCSNVDLTSYGRIGIIVFFCSCGMLVYSKVDVTPYGRSIVSLP